jgi:hypothetical protein
MGLQLEGSERAGAGGNAGVVAPDVALGSSPGREAQAVAAAEDAVLARRALALVVLLALADLWLHHHTGIGIRNIGIPVGVAAALGLGGKAAGFLFGADRVKAAMSGVTEPVKTVLRRLVTRSVLAGSAVLLATAMLLVSSVTVVSDDPAGGTVVQVTPLDRAGAGEPRRVTSATRTIPVWTTPFGRLFRVDAAGYVGAAFAVYPPIGLRLQLGRDLPALPAVLLRPAPETLGYLAEGAVLTVTRVRAQGVDTIAADTGHDSSFLLGRGGSITTALVDDWERELVGAGSSDSTAVAGMNRTILAWKKPRRLGLGATQLQIGDTLRVEVRLEGTLVGEGAIVLEGADLIDVPLQEVRLE